MHEELYRSGRAGWLRPAVLGANDGIVSTASLVIGVAAAAASRNAVLLEVVPALVDLEVAVPHLSPAVW
jgi:vacuolar iron transporter family protein